MNASAHSDVEALHRMGYAQELRRRMSTFSNFAVSFTIISILSGCLTLYAYGMNTGGPIVMNIGWPVVGIFVTLVGLAMAEVCSSYPTAGGLYYWAAKLGGKNSAAWSWFTGWFNLLGQVAVTAGIDFGGAFFMSALFNQLFNYTLDPPHIIAVYAVILFLHGLLNTFGVRLVAILNDISVWWHLVGVVIIVVVAQFYCGMSSVTANSRMIYAFSRDGAVPGSEFWHKINPRTRTPTNSIWFAAVGAFLLGLPYLWNPVAYAAVTSIAVIGLYIAYGIPILLRLLAGEKFQRGPWHLGRWSYIVGWIAVIWIGFIAILFVLPQVAPGTTLQTFNYSIIAVAVVLLYSGGYWFLSAKNWFKGPKVQGSAEELARIEAELEAVGSAAPAGARG